MIILNNRRENMSRNEYGYPMMDLHEVPMTEEEKLQAEYEAQAEVQLILAAEDEDMGEMYNYA